MPFNSVRACPEEGRKSFPFPCFRRALDKAEKKPGISSTGPAEENSRDTHIYKERFYTAP